MEGGDSVPSSEKPIRLHHSWGGAVKVFGGTLPSVQYAITLLGSFATRAPEFAKYPHSRAETQPSKWGQTSDLASIWSACIGTLDAHGKLNNCWTRS